jgi:hypothetical protein
MTDLNNIQNVSPTPEEKHVGPNIGLVAIVYTALFNLGLYFLVSSKIGNISFPTPADSVQNIAAYFRSNSQAVLFGAFFQFGSTIPLGLYVVNVVSRLRFLGIKAAGVYITLFGGIMATINLALSALILWTLSYPNLSQDNTIISTLYYLLFALGGVGFSVPLGIFIAGVSVTAGFSKLIPNWVMWFGLLLALFGELSWLSIPFPNLGVLIPLTRFPAFIWMIIVGFVLPRSIVKRI